MAQRKILRSPGLTAPSVLFCHALNQGWGNCGPRQHLVRISILVVALCNIVLLAFDRSVSFLKITVTEPCLFRFGHGLPKRAKIFKDSSDSNPLRPLLVNDQLPVQHTQSLVRLYGALCRLSDSPESFMDLCSYCLLTRQEYVPICYLCCLVPCWPAMLTRYCPLTGKMCKYFIISLFFADYECIRFQQNL